MLCKHPQALITHSLSWILFCLCLPHSSGCAGISLHTCSWSRHNAGRPEAWNPPAPQLSGDTPHLQLHYLRDPLFSLPHAHLIPHTAGHAEQSEQQGTDLEDKPPRAATDTVQRGPLAFSPLARAVPDPLFHNSAGPGILVFSHPRCLQKSPVEQKFCHFLPKTQNQEVPEQKQNRQQTVSSKILFNCHKRRSRR